VTSGGVRGSYAWTCYRCRLSMPRSGTSSSCSRRPSLALPQLGLPRRLAKRMPASPPAAKLQQELLATREYCKRSLKSRKTTNEELKAANEEALSNNEELQSTNEELETAKEELQSTNEELVTLTEQQASRNVELTQLNDGPQECSRRRQDSHPHAR